MDRINRFPWSVTFLQRVPGRPGEGTVHLAVGGPELATPSSEVSSYTLEGSQKSALLGLNQGVSRAVFLWRLGKTLSLLSLPFPTSRSHPRSLAWDRASL